MSLESGEEEEEELEQNYAYGENYVNIYFFLLFIEYK